MRLGLHAGLTACKWMDMRSQAANFQLDEPLTFLDSMPKLETFQLREDEEDDLIWSPRSLIHLAMATVPRPNGFTPLLIED